MVSRKLPHVILGLLGLQFVLGMLANLYQEVPDGAARYDVYHQFGFILFHVLNALALVVLAIVLVVQVVRRRAATNVKRGAIGGLVAIIVAYAAGILFVETGNDLLSLAMALAFLGALMSYARLAYKELK